MGCSGKYFLTKGFGEREKQVKTTIHIVNGAGKCETKPILIWKYENPSCFKGMKKSPLPVEYMYLVSLTS